MIACRISAPIAKRRGDKGSPCLTPLLQGKNFPGTPLRRTAVEAELNREETQAYFLLIYKQLVFDM
jgi:hypothetical protein